MERKRTITFSPENWTKRRFISSPSDPASPSRYCDAPAVHTPGPTSSQPCTPVLPRLSYNDYTIGWICALEVELAAAEAMFNEIHPALPRVGNDPNVYNLGRIGQHNIAVTCLPTGATGTNSAATAATNLLRSFPNLRFGLMVGIGGGVPGDPSNNPCDDIRLGDIVVSQPTDTFGGVIQYDFGKATTKDKFQRTGWLNAPPYELRTGVMKLQARHRREESLVSQFLAEMLDRYPKMARSFRHQGVEYDQLFRAGYAHQGNDRSCDRCHRDHLVVRQQRETQEPVIHYGLIGSANQVVKSGTVRERLRSELGILCVEMEAAGLMNNFPCLVVRGIADYSDTHKNERWQPYAAATAAAYAKELLQIIPAVDVESMTEAAKLPGTLCEEFDTVHSKLDSLMQVARLLSESTALSPQFKDELVSRMQNIEEKAARLIEDMQEHRSAFVPQQIHYNWAGGLAPEDVPITLLDASRAARKLYIPRIFCKSLEDFHDMLKILFRNLPGSHKVGRKEYDLEDENGTIVVGVENWHQLMTPGAKILMSMIFMRETALQKHSCPRCHAVHNEAMSQGEWVTCYNCRLAFNVQEEIRVVELPDDEDRVSSILAHMNSDIQTESGRTTIPYLSQINEEEAFSRIRYVHAKATEPAPTSTASTWKEELTSPSDSLDRSSYLNLMILQGSTFVLSVLAMYSNIVDPGRRPS